MYKVAIKVGDTVKYVKEPAKMGKPVKNGGYQWSEKSAAENVPKTYNKSNKVEGTNYYVVEVKTKTAKSKEDISDSELKIEGIEDEITNSDIKSSEKIDISKFSDIAFPDKKQDTLSAAETLINISEEEIRQLTDMITSADNAIRDIEHFIELLPDATDEEKIKTYDFLHYIRQKRRKAKDTLLVIDALKNINFSGRKYRARELNDMFPDGMPSHEFFKETGDF